MTNSPFLLGLVGFAQALPDFLGAVGGPIVDRIERRRLLLDPGIGDGPGVLLLGVGLFRPIQFWHVMGWCCSGHRQYDQSNRPPLVDQQPGAAHRSDERHRAQLFHGEPGENHRSSLGGVLISVIGVAGRLFPSTP
jgi:hypothetical protein